MPLKQTFADLILFENNYVDSDDFVGNRPFLWQKVSFPSLLGLLTHAVVIGIPLNTVKPRRFWFINFSLRTGGGYRHFQGQGEVVARGSPSRIIIISFAVCRVFTQSETLHGERFGCVPTATTPLIDFFVPVRNPRIRGAHGHSHQLAIDLKAIRSPTAINVPCTQPQGARGINIGRSQKCPIRPADDSGGWSTYPLVSCWLADAGYYQVVTVAVAVAVQYLWKPSCTVCSV